MFNADIVNQTNNSLERKKDSNRNKLKEIRQKSAMRFMDMQNVVNAKLAGSQQSVNNAENYPSTWTTNPDGGANGQV